MRLYRTLLHLYPRSFRNDYSAELCAVFARRLAEASGPTATAGVWLEAIADILGNAARLHWDLLVQDVRYTFRSLSHSRGFALTAIVVAALGIGATTASFSIADHVLVRALPFPESDRLVRMWQDQAFRGYPRIEFSPANFLDWKKRATSVQGMAAYVTNSVNLIGIGEPERYNGAMVSADLFSILGVQAALGRPLVSADEEPAAARAVVLSDGLWRSKFGADPSVLGRAVVLDDEPFVIVGVMRASFGFPTRTTELWTSFQFTPQAIADRSDTYLDVVARMKPGATLDQVRSEMQLIAAQLAREYPKENAQTGAAVFRLRDQVSRQARTLLVTLVAASLCMLLIACANLANLLVARALTREKELAVRAAIGANRDRLARQMITESAVLAVVGGALGVAIALAAIPLLSKLVPNTMPVAEVPGLDLRMLTVAGLITLCTGLGFGLLPALRIGRTLEAGVLRHGSRAGTRRSTERVRSTLVIVEVMASVVLLVASGLLVRAMWRVQEIDPGFRSTNVLTLRTTLPAPKYGETARRQQFYDRVTGDIESLPGVQRAGYISFLPMTMRGGIWPVILEISGLSPEALRSWSPDPSETRMASLRFVTPGFLDALGVPLIRGRAIDATDVATSPRAAVVSASFARQFWPDRDPIGQTFFMAFETRTVAGVVGDIRVRGLEQDSEPQVYLPATQMPDNSLMGYAPKDLVIRAAVPAASLTASVRGIISRADPQQPVSDVRLLSEVVDAETAPRRAQVAVLLSFAAIAFLLAGIGLHGLLAFAVSSRTREIGLRIALGARRSEILAMVVRRGVVLALIGVALGAGLSLGTGQLLQSLLAGVSATDPQSFAAAIGLVVAMTVLGALLPALRATRVDPVVAMREE
jgi:predicted permease